MNKYKFLFVAGFLSSLSLGQVAQAQSTDTQTTNTQNSDSQPSSPPATATPKLVATYQSLHDEIFVPKCMTCHSPGHSAKNVPLQPYSELMAQDGVVVPGDSLKSSLYVLTNNGKMPRKSSGIAPLTADEEGTLKAWIDAGAPGP